VFNIFKKKEEIKLISTSELAKQISSTKNEIEKYLIENNFIEKKEKWVIPTKIGKKRGIEERYNAKTKMKYILLPQDFKINKNQKQDKDLYTHYKEKNKTSYAEKIKKGKEYEEYIANFFREQGYTVWEHGKEKGRKDNSIDLVIKKERFIYFTQCKNWESWKIGHKEVKATRTDIREYLKEHKDIWNIIKNFNYTSKILYITAKECLTKGAYKYIEENKDIIEYKVIAMNNSQRSD